MYEKNPERKIHFTVLITITGKGGHSSVPYLTQNPILPAFRLIQVINEKLLYEFDSFQNVAFFPAALNSGKQQNIIADQSFIKFRGECVTVENKIQLLQILAVSLKSIENLYHIEAKIDYED